MVKISLFVVIFIPIIIIYELYCYVKYKSCHTSEYWILRIIFYAYLLFLIKVTFFPIPIQKEELEFSRQMYGNGFKNNLIPFQSIMEIIGNKSGLKMKILQLGGNLIMLIPLTFYLPLLNKKFHNLKNIFYW